MDSSCILVNVKRSVVVAPVLPVQDHWLPMSNLDLLVPPVDVGVFFCYKKKNDLTTSENMVTIIMKALAKALESFYPFAGEVVQNRLGEPELHCNNRGVDFLHAFSDIEFKGLDLYHFDISIHGNFIPFKKQGVLSIQVTELKCGGLVVGCTFDHRVADAYSTNMFLTTWAEIAQAKATTHAPSFRRSLLIPRRLSTYNASIDNLCILMSFLQPTKILKSSDDRLLGRIYYVEAEEIAHLQSTASHNGCRRTKLESFSAFLWKTIAEGSGAKIKKISLGIVVDGRKRLKGCDIDDQSLSMQNYFGNVLSVPSFKANVCDLKEMDLKGVAEMVHECIEDANREDHFLGLVDWIELHRPQPTAFKIFCNNCDDEEAIVVSSGLRFPVSQINFGWGLPDFGSYRLSWDSQTGYVMPMPSVSREGDWIVYMYLKKKHLDVVESKAAHVFKPLNPSYLKMI